MELPKSIPLPGGRELRSWPAMIRFPDIIDVISLQKVEPDVIGVKRIWLETTREPVTRNVDKRFPHLLENLKAMKMIRRKTSGGNNVVWHDTPIFDLVGPSDFSAGFRR